MYVLVAYDVKARRTPRFHKLLSQWLVREQNSVFAGDLTEAQLRALDAALGRLIRDDDRVLQVLATNRHNVSVKILRKAQGNAAMIKAEHDHHKTNSFVV